MAKKKQQPKQKVGFELIKPRRGQKLMTLGHLRQVIADLPDDMMFGPTWNDYAPDHWPQIEFVTLGIERDEEGGARVAVGIDGHPLDDE